MRTKAACSRLSALLVLTCTVGSAPLWPMETQRQPGTSTIASTADEQAFRDAINQIESNHGAYAAGLSEQLLSLGQSLQSQGRHQEAVDLFKRGVHLARINDGLYSGEQIPLLQGEIASHVALGQYSVADERQRYLYRVQVRSMESGNPRAMAFMQQANWQYNAYRLQLGEMAYSRLMNMWDLYRLALTDIMDREGADSADLLPPLHGMLRAQYLISDYDSEQDEVVSSGAPDDLGTRQELNRFNAYRAQSYKKGSAVIQAIYDIHQQRPGDQSLAKAAAQTMLGDWQLWHDERDDAEQSYRNAIMELGERDDAQLQIDTAFGQPVALPNMKGVRRIPDPVPADEGDILLEFTVSKRGKVLGLDRIDDNDVNVGRANGLMRKLRKMKFRPRFEAGEPVETENIVKAYVID